MTKKSKLIFYILVIAVFGALIFWITERGFLLEAGKITAPTPDAGMQGTAFDLFAESFLKNLFHPLAILIPSRSWSP